VVRKIKQLLGRQPSRPAGRGQPITLADPAKAIVLELPATLDAKDAYGLSAVRVPSVPAGQWLLIRTSRSANLDRARVRATTGAIEIDDQR